MPRKPSKIIGKASCMVKRHNEEKRGRRSDPIKRIDMVRAYRLRPPRSSTASQKAPAKRGSEAAMRAFVAIQPEGVPVS